MQGQRPRQSYRRCPADDGRADGLDVAGNANRRRRYINRDDADPPGCRPGRLTRQPESMEEAAAVVVQVSVAAAAAAVAVDAVADADRVQVLAAADAVAVLLLLLLAVLLLLLRLLLHLLDPWAVQGWANDARVLRAATLLMMKMMKTLAPSVAAVWVCWRRRVGLRCRSSDACCCCC